MIARKRKPGTIIRTDAMASAIILGPSIGMLGCETGGDDYYGCNTRGGCMGVLMFLAVRVQPVAGANMDSKRVGVQWDAGSSETRTASCRSWTCAVRWPT